MINSPIADSLREHKKEIEERKLKELFQEDPERANRFSINLNLHEKDHDFIHFDYSKNLMTEETLNLLVKLAEESRVSDAIEEMFNGDNINVTEKRAARHVDLRAKEPIKTCERRIK